MAQLKLAALDGDGLKVISAHMQDAVMRVGDVHGLAGKGKFALIANRYDWTAAGDAKGGIRRQCGLQFARVQSVRARNIVQANKDAVLSLLAITFVPGAQAPSGQIELVFSGGGQIVLEVECIEVQLEDLGPAWQTANTPAHEESDDGTMA